MDITLYDLWPEVPVNFGDCKTLEEQLKHRIRRAFEKMDDYGYAPAGGYVPSHIAGQLVYEKLVSVPAIARLLEEQS